MQTLTWQRATTDPGPLFTTARRMAPRPSPRLASVDILRGLVMVIMVLDHVRAYLSEAHFPATDLGRTTPALFFARWVTHVCAPTFVLLAGASAWMVGRRKGVPYLSRYLLTRGLWLVFLELTVVNFGWYWNLRYEHGFVAQVIWAIGLSMMVLAGLVRLPRAAIAAVAVTLIVGHNLLDGVTVPARWALPWSVLHVEQAHPAAHLLVRYPVLPWIGVMAAGYLVGGLLTRPADRRARGLAWLGGGMVAGFVVLRALNLYGDPAPWQAGRDGLWTAMAFLNLTKYPPSLLFLLMTLGPALLALLALESARGRVAGWLGTIGRVPLFFYVVHIYVVHALAVILGVASGFRASEMTRLFLDFPARYGVSLPAVLALWGLVVIGLYPACRWYEGRKRRGKGWWWGYI